MRPTEATASEPASQAMARQCRSFYGARETEPIGSKPLRGAGANAPSPRQACLVSTQGRISHLGAVCKNKVLRAMGVPILGISKPIIPAFFNLICPLIVPHSNISAQLPKSG